MGKAISRIKHPLRNFNLESRVNKIISKDKPVPAPKHKSDLEKYERILKEHPEKLQDKQGALNNNLREVYVNSQDPKIVKLHQAIEDPDKLLPLDRTPVEDYEFGFKEPSRVSFGKVTLRKALRFISEHQADVKTNNVDKIAEDYVLSEEKVRNILKYFHVYEVYFPEKAVKATFAGPSMPRTHITEHKPKQIVSSNTK